MKETITIPEGVREIEISKCCDRVIIEFVPEEKKAIKPSDIFKIEEEKLLMAKIKAYTEKACTGREGV